MPETRRPLKVFLCHAHPDQDAVHDLYLHLITDNVDAWLDKEKLIGGQDWEFEIRKAVRESDVVIVCLSKQFAQRGFRQYEVRIALEEANLQPEGEIFIIPLRLEECNVPQNLRRWHWVDLFEDDGYERLMRALRARADRIGATLQLRRSWLPKITSPRTTQGKPVKTQKPVTSNKNIEEKSDITPDTGLPHTTKPPLPPEKFRESSDNELQPSFEPDPIREEGLSSAKLDLEPSTSTQETTHHNTRTIAVEGVSSQSSNSLKLAISKTKPFLRMGGFLGIILALFWVGSWLASQFPSGLPTAEHSITPRLSSPTAPLSLAVTFTKTVEPSATVSVETKTPAATALPTEITDAQGTTMVLVPAGMFVMGTDTDVYVLDVDQKPAHNVILDAFYIDKYEVINALYKICVEAGDCTRPHDSGSSSISLYYGNSKFDNYPVIYVDWYQARAYCEWRGARLPTEAEWEKAAQGSEGPANFSATSGDTTEVGNYPTKSVYGAYDMAGNVWEWANDWYQSDYYTVVGDNAVNPQGPQGGDSKVLRGGSWRVGGIVGGMWREGNDSPINRYRDFPSRFYNDIGFRCARSVP